MELSFPSKKLHFAEDGEHYRKPQLVKIQKITDCWMSNIYSTTPTPKAKGTSGNKGLKAYKIQRTMKSPVSLCLFEMMWKAYSRCLNNTAA